MTESGPDLPVGIGIFVASVVVAGLIFRLRGPFAAASVRSTSFWTSEESARRFAVALAALAIFFGLYSLVFMLLTS